MYDILLWVIALILVVSITKTIARRINFYPSKRIMIDITKQKKMDDNDLLDYYIISYGTEEIEKHVNEIRLWKQNRLQKIGSSKNKIKRFETRCKKNEIKAFNIVGIRVQTRYRQQNYQRYSYKVNTVSNSFFISDEKIMARIRFLKEHNYNVTYNNYTKVDQRKALTKELREMIKVRDNYTCQICGKYMPDEVGLQIDHIVSIKDGGKSVPDNLRVLCSKCNGKKGANSD